MTTKNQSRRAMQVLIALALTIANAAPAAGALPIKACDLLSAKDVQGVLGSGYTPQESLNNQIMSSCAYTKSKMDVVTITIMQEFRGAAQRLRMEQEGARQQVEQ